MRCCISADNLNGAMTSHARRSICVRLRTLDAGHSMEDGRDESLVECTTSAGGTALAMGCHRVAYVMSDLSSEDVWCGTPYRRKWCISME